jgi:hypothetical protein
MALTKTSGWSRNIAQVKRKTRQPSATSAFCRHRSDSKSSSSFWCNRPSISIANFCCFNAISTPDRRYEPADLFPNP